jgi:hypothetical protein
MSKDPKPKKELSDARKVERLKDTLRMIYALSHGAEVVMDRGGFPYPEIRTIMEEARRGIMHE